jgi:hypothetical protein
MLIKCAGPFGAAVQNALRDKAAEAADADFKPATRGDRRSPLVPIEAGPEGPSDTGEISCNFT